MASAQDPAPAEAEPAEPTNIVFNFSETSWEEVARWLADIGKRSLLIESKPTGTFSYFDKRAYSFREALDVINGVLLTKGHALLLRNNFLILADLKDGVPPHMVERVEPADLPKLGRTELVKVLLTLKGLVADEAKKEFESMSSPHGRIISLPTTNQLLIVDTAQNAQQIVSLITELEEGDGKADLRAFPLKHVSARDIERVVRDLLGLAPRETERAGAAPAAAQQQNQQRGGGDGDRRERFRAMMAQFMGGGEGGGPPGPPGAPPAAGQRNPNGPFVSVDERTNTLFVAATPDKLALVAQVVTRLDTPENADNAVEQTPRIEVYPVEAGDAEGLSKVLQSVFEASADLKVTAHPDGRSLIIYATPRDHERLRTVLGQIKSEGLRVEVVPLRVLDATTTATLIQSLLGQKEDDSPRPRFSFFDRDDPSAVSKVGPSIEADVERNRLIVRGTDPQIQEIRGLLVKLGEVGLAGDRDAADRYRVVPLTGQDPQELAESVRRLWNRLGTKTPIRVEVLRPRSAPPGEKNDEPRSPKGELDGLDLRRPPADEREAPRALPADENDQDQSRYTPRWSNKTWELVSYQEEEPEGPTGEKEPADVRAEEKGAEPKTDGADGVTIVVGPDNVAIFSDDPQTLEMVENLINSVARGESTTGFAYFFLRVADAQETAYLLDQALYGEQRRSSFFFEEPEKPNRARILPDIRANALLVVGPPAEQRKIEQLLEVLDSEDRPSNIATPRPYVIPVQYSDAEAIAQVVREVFAAQLFDAQARNRPNLQNLAQMSPFGGLSRRSSQSQRPDTTQGKLTVGVDEKTNSLIIAAPAEIFREVERLVQTLDNSAREQGRSARVVTLQNTSPEAVEKTLGNLFGVRTTDELQAERQERAKLRAEEEQERRDDRGSGRGRRNRQRELEDTLRNLQTPGFIPGGFGPRPFNFD